MAPEQPTNALSSALSMVAYCNFGPAPWRHTFGTVLGICGWSSLEIARVMGNSEDVAKSHYVAATSAGKRGGARLELAARQASGADYSSCYLVYGRGNKGLGHFWNKGTELK